MLPRGSHKTPPSFVTAAVCSCCCAAEMTMYYGTYELSFQLCRYIGATAT